MRVSKLGVWTEKLCDRSLASDSVRFTWLERILDELSPRKRNRIEEFCITTLRKYNLAWVCIVGLKFN